MSLPWLQRLLPSQCLLCGHDSGRAVSLCRPCAEALPWHGPACPGCAAALPPGAAAATVCGACLRRPPPLVLCRALFDYRGPVARLLTGLKFGHELSHAAALGELLAEAAAAWPEPVAAVLPVPLHPERLRARGFNQALELARPVARRLGLPLLTRSVARTAATPEQSTLSEDQRKRNLRRAFAVAGAVPDSVLVVDDVLTTGSTLRALAETLRRAGVARISALVVAKTRYGAPRA